jgi:hypothetical protein
MRKSANIKSYDFIFRDFLFLHFRKSPNPRSMCHRSAAQTSGTAVPKLPDNRCGIQDIPPLRAGTEKLCFSYLASRSRWIGARLHFCGVLRNFVTPARKGKAFPFVQQNQLTQILIELPWPQSQNKFFD